MLPIAVAKVPGINKRPSFKGLMGLGKSAVHSITLGTYEVRVVFDGDYGALHYGIEVYAHPRRGWEPPVWNRWSNSFKALLQTTIDF